MLFEQDPVFLLIKIMLSTVMTLLMMASITTFKYPKQKTLLYFACYLAYVMIASVIMVLCLSWIVILRVFVLIITLPAIILIYFLAWNSVTQALFNYATQVDLFIFLSVTATLLNTGLKGNQVTDLLIRFVLFASAALVQYRFVRHPFCRLTESLRKNWLSMSLIPVAFFVLLLLCALFPGHYTENVWTVVQIYCIFAVMGIVYFVMFQSLSRSYRLLEMRLETEVMNAQLLSPRQYMERLLENRKTARDIRRGISRIHNLLETGKTYQANKALHTLSLKLTPIDGKPLCPDPCLNEVLTCYSAKFHANHIPFTIDMDLNGLQLPTAEVCLILNNALENALEASLTIPVHERKVHLQAIPRQQQFLMRVSNRFDGRLTIRNHLPLSTKQGAGHGYGLTSIRAAAMSVGGDMVVHIKNETTFILDARIRILSGREPASDIC